MDSLSRFTGTARGAALGLVLSAALSTVVGAQVEMAYEQLTTEPFGFGMFEPTLGVDGAHIAFRTTADLVAGNPDHNFEVFLTEVATGAMLQLTDTPSGVGNFTPLVGPGGAFVVFRATFDFVGENPDGMFELFEVDVASGAFRQITHNPAGVSVFDPELSADGEWLTYRMSGDPLGLNPDGNFEIFRLHRTTGVIDQITQTTTGNRECPSIDGDGSRIAFAARENYDGSNANGNQEIWIWDAGTGAITAVTTNPTGLFSDHPSLDADGRFVSFVSNYDHTGGNAPGAKVHVVDTGSGAVQLATTTGTSNPFLGHSMSPDGATCVFESDRDLTGENGNGGRELFAFSTATGVLRQLTMTPPGLSKNQLSGDMQFRYVDVSGNGSLAYRSEQDLDPLVINSPGSTNLDLFVGRQGGCAGEAYGAGAFAVAQAGFTADVDLGFAPTPGQQGQGAVTVTGGAPSAPLAVLFSLSPAVPGSTGKPLWVGLPAPFAVLFLTTDALGELSIPLGLSGLPPVSIYSQVVSVEAPGSLLFSNGLRLTFCP